MEIDMKRVLVFGLLLVSGIVHAQYYTEPDTMRVEKKNTLGVFITTPVVWLMGGSPRVPRAAVQFKRNLRPERSLRVTATYDQLNGYYDSYDYALINVVSVSDTSITYDWRYDYSWRATLRGGMEWSSPSKKLGPYYGFDGILGYGEKYDYRTLETYKADTLGGNLYPNTMESISSVPYRAETRSTLWAGFDFTVGWRIRFGKGWQWQTQFSPEFYVLIDRNVRVQQGTFFSPEPWTTVDMRLRMLESMICYRF